MSTETSHYILLAVQRQVAGLVAEKMAQQTQIDGLVAERDALRSELDAMTTRRNYWRKLYHGDGAEIPTAPALFVHSPGYPVDDGEYNAAAELTDTGLSYAQLDAALHAQVSYE